MEVPTMMTVDSSFSRPSRPRPGRAPESSELVIGTDDRFPVADVRAAPFSWICLLRIQGPSGRRYSATGWLAGPSLVITASHAVFLKSENAWATSVSVLVGLDGQTAAASVTSSELAAAAGSLAEGSDEYDLGAIFLPRPLGLDQGYFSFAALDDQDLLNGTVQVTGYPADRDNATRQYTHARVLTGVTPTRLRYDIDTFGGQSGSPIWRLVDGRPTAVGVHTTGDVNINEGLRFSRGAMTLLREWKNHTNEKGAQP
jgi:V8-like Glu-specific endopeptidase